MVDGELKEMQQEGISKMKRHLASDGSCPGGELTTSLARSGWSVVQAERGTGKT